MSKIDAIANADLPGWTEKHERELRFQEDKRTHRIQEQAANGQIFKPDAVLMAAATTQREAEKTRSIAAAKKVQREPVKPARLPPSPGPGEIATIAATRDNLEVASEGSGDRDGLGRQGNCAGFAGPP